MSIGDLGTRVSLKAPPKDKRLIREMPGIIVERHLFPHDGHPGGCSEAAITHLLEFGEQARASRETAGSSEPATEGEREPRALGGHLPR